MKKNKFVAMRRLLAWALIFASLLTPTPVALAAEVNVPEAVAQQVEAPVTYGSLSGYGQKDTSATCSFKMSVNGSWSPWAGCTLRTEGFDSATINEIKVSDASGKVKAQATLEGNMEVANLAMLNVSPGEYKVTTIMSNPSSGRIIVHVY
mgnify:CR=1 FL=1